MILRPTPTPAQLLTWVPEGRYYVAEESDLPSNMGRVYDDACDVGLTLISRYDGSERVFVVNDTHTNADGDVEYWDLVPAEGLASIAQGKKPEFSIRIFND